MLDSLTEQLRSAQALSAEQVRAAILALTEEQVPVELKAATLNRYVVPLLSPVMTWMVAVEWNTTEGCGERPT